MQRLNERLQKLQQTCDEFREKVQKYDDNRVVQALNTLSESVQAEHWNVKFVMEQIIRL